MNITLKTKSDYLALAAGKHELTQLDYDFDLQQVLRSLKVDSEGGGKTVLLLGANGFVGMHILCELVEHPKIQRVLALVRRKDKTSGRERLAASMAAYGMSFPDDSKLEVIEGALSKDGLKVNGKSYSELCAAVDTVVHSAGVTNHLYSYAYYREEALIPLLKVVEFCLTTKKKSLHYVGSVGCEVYRQRREFFRLGFFHCGYSRMKWVVKHLLLQMHERGIPSYVYLPGFLLGSEKTRFRDPGLGYSFWHILRGVNTLGLMWDTTGYGFPVVGADTFAERIVENIFSESPNRAVYPTMIASGDMLAQKFGWHRVSWKEFRSAQRAYLARNIIESSLQMNSKKLAKSIRKVMIAKSLFPAYLPLVIENVTVASKSHETFHPRTEADAVELVWKCVRGNELWPVSSDPATPYRAEGPR